MPLAQSRGQSGVLWNQIADPKHSRYSWWIWHQHPWEVLRGAITHTAEERCLQNNAKAQKLLPFLLYKFEITVCVVILQLRQDSFYRICPRFAWWYWAPTRNFPFPPAAPTTGVGEEHSGWQEPDTKRILVPRVLSLSTCSEVPASTAFQFLIYRGLSTLLPSEAPRAR